MDDTKVKTPRRNLPETDRRGQSKLNADMDAIARAAGWKHWSEYRTAVRNGKIRISKKPKNSV